MTTKDKMNMPTLDSLKDEVRKAGYTPSEASWEDWDYIHAFSVQTTYGTLGHPAFCANYCKPTGWLSIDGQTAVNLKHQTR